MSKEKEMLKELLANTRAIMEHLKISPTAPSEKKSAKAAKPAPNKSAPARKNK